MNTHAYTHSHTNTHVCKHIDTQMKANMKNKMEGRPRWLLKGQPRPYKKLRLLNHGTYEQLPSGLTHDKRVGSKYI